MSLRNSTLVFLVKKQGKSTPQICLAMKKRGFGIGRWNGVGGKVEEGETIEDGAKREAREEIAVALKDIRKVAELSFYFSHNSSWDQLVHVYFSQNWENEPTESGEMNPRWFRIEEIPFQTMWPDDIFWLPEVLRGKLIKAAFTFGEKDVIQDKEIEIVESF